MNYKMSSILYKSAVFLSVICSCVTAEYYSSVIGLEKLMETEALLIKDINMYLEYTKQHLQILQNEINKIQMEHTYANKNMEQYLTNPINSYRLIKRLHTDWDIYKSQIEDFQMHSYFISKFAAHKEKLCFPSNEDLYGSALALLRLQEMYELEVTALSSGMLNGVKYGHDMTWQDCFTLGVNLYELKQYNSSKVWFKESVNRLIKEQYHPNTVSLDYLETVAETLLELGDIKNAMNYSMEVMALDANRMRAKKVIEKIYKGDIWRTVSLENENEYDYHQFAEYKHYQELCRGKVKTHKKQQKQLFCRLLTNDIPYRILSPFKMEELEHNPLIVIFHDIITHEQVSIIRQLATPSMQRSMVRGKTPFSGFASDVRVSQQAWLPYEKHESTLQMLQDLNDATGLNTLHCEELQVVNYGLGGHYEPHFDFFTDEVQIPNDKGNRIATAIFYLSDVEEGGATVFPYLDIAVKPVKGDMLLWYNLHYSTDRDYRTKHAGCPVLKGSKWIANIWVSELTQTFTRPCLLQNDRELSTDFMVPK